MISVDPGVHGSGLAFWEGNRLIAVTYEVPQVAEGRYLEHMIIEVPQVYMGSRSKGNPNDLIKLAFEAGRIACMAPTHEVIKPRTWKGTIKKEVMLRRILTKLDDTELAYLKALNLPPSKEKECVDAIGIGLYILGRL
jgi:hypothetical protein